MFNTPKGIYVWNGDGFNHTMDILGSDKDIWSIESETLARRVAVYEAIDYIRKWKPGWEDFIQGWD